MNILWLIVFGLLSAVLAGMGMGGGTLLIPLLTIFLGINQKVAQGINLIVFIPIAIIALIIHFSNGMVERKNTQYVILPGIAFACLGAYLTTLVPKRIVAIIFGVFLVFIGITQLVQFFKDVKQKNK